MNGQRRPVLLVVACLLATGCAALAGFGGATAVAVFLFFTDDWTPKEVASAFGAALGVTSLAIAGAYACYRWMLQARGHVDGRAGFDVLPPR
jgi:uncharacterized membrane protein YfcA